MASVVRILNGALTEQSDGEIVLRGILDPESLGFLHTDDYQREVLVGKGKGGDKMVKVIDEKVHFPDIELGMRGQKFEEEKDGVYTLHNPVFIIDGLQRTSAIKEWMERNPKKKLPVSLGVKVHFGTNYKIEKRLFTIWNGSSRRRVSPNILLRNLRDEHPALLTLYGLTKSEQSFPLCGRVTWTQQAFRSDLLTAMNLVKTVSTLTRRFWKGTYFPARKLKTPGGGNARDMLPSQLDAVAKEMSLSKFRTAVVKFYELVDACWGIRNVVYTNKSTHLRGNFLITLAMVLNDHDNFWKGNDLVIDADFKKRIKSFPVTDPEVARLASAGHMAIILLYDMMVKHLNARRHEGNRLVRRKGS